MEKGESDSPPSLRCRRLVGRSDPHYNSIRASIDSLDPICGPPSILRSPGMSRKAYGALEELAPINVTGETNRHRFRIESGSGNDDSEQVRWFIHIVDHVRRTSYAPWFLPIFLGTRFSIGGLSGEPRVRDTLVLQVFSRKR
jgi:hypothetical protein